MKEIEVVAVARRIGSEVQGRTTGEVAVTGPIAHEIGEKGLLKRG